MNTYYLPIKKDNKDGVIWAEWEGSTVNITLDTFDSISPLFVDSDNVEIKIIYGE